MPLTALGTIAHTALALSLLSEPAAQADPYKWCAHYFSRGDDYGFECTYVTSKQCMDSISGVGGACEPNPFYDGLPVVDEYSRPQRTHRRPRGP